ncbi:MAG: hypothetical protein IJD24_05045 [Agathobacter sp.]|nr:hypothetical protein [Agathobacter sp.]
MGIIDLFLYSFGFGFGANATKIAINKGEEAYRKKYFDDVVLQDIKMITEKGGLIEKKYPFPSSDKVKRPPFFVRHKILCGSWVVLFVLEFILYQIYIKSNNLFFLELMTYAIPVFWVFGVGCFIVILIKKILRGGKKVVDFSFKDNYIHEGQEYWKLREQVRQALQARTINSQTAIQYLRNTALGRRITDIV